MTSRYTEPTPTRGAAPSHPRRHQWVAVAGKIAGAADWRNARRRPVRFQSAADFFDERGSVVPPRLIGVRRDGNVLQSSYRRHEPRQLRRCLNRCDPCEFADIVLGVRHVRFQISISSSVVVMVASSDSMLSMIEFA